MDPTIGLLGIIAALIGTIALLLPRVVRNAASKEATEAYERAAAALRVELNDSERRWGEEVASYKAKVDALTGRIAALEEDFAERIAVKVADKVGARLENTN